MVVGRLLTAAIGVAVAVSVIGAPRIALRLQGGLPGRGRCCARSCDLAGRRDRASAPARVGALAGAGCGLAAVGGVALCRCVVDVDVVAGAAAEAVGPRAASEPVVAAHQMVMPLGKARHGDTHIATAPVVASDRRI